MKYAKGDPVEGWRYRRVVPERLRGFVGKREFKLFLGQTYDEVVRSYANFHALVERQLKDAERRLARGDAPTLPPGDSDLDRYQSLRAQIRALGLNPDDDPHPTDLDGDSAHHLYAQRILDDYPVEERTSHPDYGSPVLPEAAAELVKALFNGLPPKPVPTLSDALKLYVAEKAAGEEAEDVKKRGRLETIVGRSKQVLGGDRRLSDIPFADAMAIRDHFAKTTAPTTVRRYLNDLQGIASLTIKRERLNIVNPFSDIPSVETDAQRAVRAERGRKRIPPEALEETALKVREHIRHHATPELLNLWLLLELTGARTKEITGLRKEDVVLAGPHAPYVAITFTKNRRLKNFSSVRYVPLLPTAKRAAEAALNEAPESPFLFPTYANGLRGADKASNNLREDHFYKVRTDDRIVPHTMRNRLISRMTKARVPKDIRERIEGRGASKVSNAYDLDSDTYAQMVEAFTKAFPEEFPDREA